MRGEIIRFPMRRSPVVWLGPARPHGWLVLSGDHGWLFGSHRDARREADALAVQLATEVREVRT